MLRKDLWCSKRGRVCFVVSIRGSAGLVIHLDCIGLHAFSDLVMLGASIKMFGDRGLRSLAAYETQEIEVVSPLSNYS